MDDVLALEFPPEYVPGAEVHHPDDPPGEWDWLINLLVDPIRAELWSSLTGYMASILGGLGGPLREIRDRVAWLLAALYAIPGAINAQIGQLREQIVSQLAFWLNRLYLGVQGLGPALSAVLNALPWVLPAVLGGPFGLLTAGLSAAGHLVGGYLAAHLGSILPALYQVGAALITYLPALLPALLPLPGLLGVLPAALWAAMRPDLVREPADFLSRAAQTAAAGVPAQMNAVTGQLQRYLSGGLELVEDLVLGQGHIEPEMAHEAAVRGFLGASALGFGAHALATAIELLHPLRYVGLHYLSGFVGQMGGFAPISYAIMGTMARIGIARPMEYNVLARTRPMIPSVGDVQAMHRKHTLTGAEFGQYMAYHGFTDWWIQRYREYLPADPRLYDILRMADTNLPTAAPPAGALAELERMGIRGSGNPNWWLELKFAKAGYDWVDIPQLVDTVRRRLSSTERTRFITTSSTNFRQGYMDEPQFRANLAEAGLNSDQVNWKVRAEALAALYDDVNDLVVLYTDRYLKDVITEDELLLALVNVGVTPRKARILTDRAAIRKTPKPTSAAKAEEEKALKAFQTKASELYRRQYQADLISAEQYYDALLAIGITDRLAAVTVQIEMTKKSQGATEVAIRDEEKAAAKTRAVYEKLYREQYQAGELDADGYYQRLLALGIPAADAQGTVALEVVKQTAAARRAELSEQEKEQVKLQREQAELYARQYRLGTIDEQTLYDRLVGAGVSAPLAATAVQLEMLKRQADAEKIYSQIIVPALRVPFEVAVAQLRAQLEEGTITTKIYVQELLETGLDRATADLIAEILG